MRAIKPDEIRTNQRKVFDEVYEGEILLIIRPHKKNVVVLSEDEFNKRDKALRNIEYLAKLDASIAQAERGQVIKYTMEELKTLTNGV